MKKLIKIILIIAVVSVGIYAFDMYSGYSISKYVDEKIHFTAAPNEPASIQTNHNVQGLNAQLYSRLSDEDKKMYDTIYYGVSEHKNPIFIGFNQESEKVFDMLKIVLCEHPELFWNNGNCSFSSSGYLTVNYSCSKEEAQVKARQIEAKVNEILSSLSGGEQEKAAKLFDYVVESTEYDFENVGNIENVPTISSIEGVFLDGKAVCGGYAKAYQYLLQKAGMQALYVTGEANSPEGEQRHGWVCQQINGENYFSDPTWSDCFESQSYSDFISHTYFCLNSNEISATHTCDDKFSNIISDKSSYNYFKQQGLYFEDYNTADIRAAIKNRLEENQVGVELKFSSDEVYHQAVEGLIDKQELYYILISLDLFSVNISTTQVSYSEDETHNVLTIFYEKK